MNSIEIKTALSESDLTAIINGVVDALMPRLNPKMEDDAKLKRADLCEIFGCHYSTLKRKYFIDPGFPKPQGKGKMARWIRREVLDYREKKNVGRPRKVG